MKARSAADCVQLRRPHQNDDPEADRKTALRVAEKFVVLRIELSESFHVFGRDAGECAIVRVRRSVPGPAWKPDVLVDAEHAQYVVGVGPQRLVATDEVVRDGARLTELVLRRPVHVRLDAQRVDDESYELVEGDVVSAMQ